MKLLQWTNEFTSNGRRDRLEQRGIDLAWEKHATLEDTFRHLERNQGDGHWFPGAIIPASAAALTINDIIPESAYLDELDNIRPFDFPATDPTNLRVAGIAATSFRMFWQDNATNEKHYEIWIKRAGGKFRIAKTVRANGTTALIKSQSQGGATLNQNTQYTVKVRAINGSGVPSGFSREVTLRTLPRADKDNSNPLVKRANH